MSQQSEFGIDTLPYNDRQTIVVVDDDVLAAHEPREAPRRPLINRAIQLRDRVLDGPPPMLTRAEQVLHSVDRLSRDGIAILPVARSEASELLLPAGHPLDGMVYVGDPAKAARYHLLADFHVRVFEAKVTDAIDLLGALGARTIFVESVEGYGQDVAGAMNFPVNVTKVRIKSRLRRRVDKHVLFQADLGATRARELDDIPWLKHEPMWQSIARLRRDGDLRQFSLAVSTNNDLQITADASARMSKAQLGAGGEFHEWRKTQWTMKGEFGEQPKRSVRGRS